MRLEGGDESPHSKDASRRGNALALSRLRLQLPTDVDAPRGGSALRTGRSKALRFLERPRTATGKLPAAQTAFGVFLYDFFM